MRIFSCVKINSDELDIGEFNLSHIWSRKGKSYMLQVHVCGHIALE